MTCSDIARRWVDMRRSGTFPEKPQVSALPIITTDNEVTKGLTSGSQVVWVTFLGSRKPPHSYTECATPPHVHPTPRYITAHDHPTVVHSSTSSDKCWGGVRRPGSSVQG